MKNRFLALALAAGMLAASPALGQGLPSAKPEEVGLSSARLQKISDTLRQDIEKGQIPGASLLVVRHDKVAYFETFGSLDPESRTPMTKDAIFRIYSMTKPITSVAAMMLVEDGRLQLADPVSKHLPEFKDVKVGIEKPGPDGKPVLEEVAPRRAMTVQDLLRHTSGLTYGVFGDSLVKKAYRESGLITGDFDNAEFTTRIARLPLMLHPGSTWEYSHSTDILGRIVEVVSGQSLYAFKKERILDPLGMTDTAYYVTDPAKQPRIAEPFKNDRNIGAGADMFDPRIQRRYESGGGGMVGTVGDYARFAQMLLNGGTLDGKRILGPQTVAYMTSDHLGSISPGPAYLPGDGYGFGLGFAVRKEDGVSAQAGTRGDYNWGGAGGTYYWADPRQDMFVVFAMQSPKQRVYYRGVLRNMIYAALLRSPER